MVSITKNEARVINLILRDFTRDYNINQIAKELKLSPRGAYKILKKLEKNEIVLPRKIGNNIIYKINFKNSTTASLCQFVLTEKETTPYTKVWINDLQQLRQFTDIAVLFGSVLTKERQANDIDILLVFEKNNLAKVQEQIEKINTIKPKKIHAIMQTKKDLINNLKNKDTALLEEIKTGMILWGENMLFEAIKKMTGDKP